MMLFYQVVPPAAPVTGRIYLDGPAPYDPAKAADDVARIAGMMERTRSRHAHSRLKNATPVSHRKHTHGRPVKP